MTEIFLKYPNQETKWKNLLNCTPLKLGIYVYQRHLMKAKKNKQKNKAKQNKNQATEQEKAFCNT